MAEYRTHVLYSEYGANYDGNAGCYDPETKITVWGHLKVVLDQNHKVTNLRLCEVFIRKPGDPAKTKPDHLVHLIYKGQMMQMWKEETGLRLLFPSHNTEDDPHAPPWGRLNADETVVIPNVFVKG